MATTSSKRVAGAAALGGQGGSGGKHGRFGLRAKVAAGAVALGCAAALALGVLRASHTARPQPQVAPAARNAQAGGYARQRFLEVNLHLPDGTLAVPSTTSARQRFLEANLHLPDGILPVVASTAERQRFLEANLWFPASAAPATIPSADRANLR